MYQKAEVKLGAILKGLFEPYLERVPDVSKITSAMINSGLITQQTDIVNDHIAFRTLGVPNLGIASLEKIFLHHGYVKMDYYYFKAKKLDAFWYAPPSKAYPRIFISELRVNELSPKAQKIVLKHTAQINADPADEIDLEDVAAVGAYFYRPLWSLPTIADFEELAKESEYASWVLYNRYYLNHYTISVHELNAPYNTLERFNSFLESIGIVLNESGGKIKTSKDGLLKQSSSVAQLVEATFRDGDKKKIPGSYVEFAERLPLESGKGVGITGQEPQRREGFESANADKIFESTYNAQIAKRRAS